MLYSLLQSLQVYDSGVILLRFSTQAEQRHELKLAYSEFHAL